MTLKTLKKKIAEIPEQYDEFEVWFKDGYGVCHLGIDSVEFSRNENAVVIAQKKSKYGRNDR